MYSLLKSSETIIKIEICSYCDGRSRVNSLTGYYGLEGGSLGPDSTYGYWEGGVQSV